LLADAVGAFDAGEHGPDPRIAPDGKSEQLPDCRRAPADGGDLRAAAGQGSEVVGDVRSRGPTPSTPIPAPAS
jgi:hypothetical protein